MEVGAPDIKKKTLGKRKIPIQKIEKPSSRQVTFTKRRYGLFKKATELTVLCGAQIAMLVQSPAGKIFAFGNPSVDALIRRFESSSEEEEEDWWETMEARFRESEIRRRFEEVRMKLEAEMERERGFWWDLAIEEMELEQLEEYAAAMDGLRENVVRRIEEMEKLRTTTTTSCSEMAVANTTSYLHQQQYCSKTGSRTGDTTTVTTAIPAPGGFAGGEFPLTLQEIEEFLDSPDFDVDWSIDDSDILIV